MRIVVTGDTHLSPRRLVLPSQLVESIEKADLTIHTGDFSTAPARDLFESLGPLLAVCGNNEEATLGSSLPGRLDLVAGEKTIVVAHGHSEGGRSARDGVQRAYAGRVDLVVFGHSHMPLWEEIDGTWLLNPGSPTMKRREPQFSFAVLEIGSSGALDVSFSYFD